MKKNAFFGLLVFILVFGFNGCGGDDDQKIYTVTIGSLANGSIMANPSSGIEGTEITLTIIPDELYKLKIGSLKYGTTVINEETKKFYLPASNVIITAEFETIPESTFSVIFDSNGGSDVQMVTGIESRTTIELPTNPTKPENDFSGWYIDNETFLNEFNSSIEITSNLIVYAKWNPFTVPSILHGIWINGDFENLFNKYSYKFSRDSTRSFIVDIHSFEMGENNENSTKETFPSSIILTGKVISTSGSSLGFDVDDNFIFTFLINTTNDKLIILPNVSMIYEKKPNE